MKEKKLNERQEELKKRIEEGLKPVVLNCSTYYDNSTFTLGDIEDIGWMNKRYTHDGEGEVDGWERDYYGPKSFRLSTHGSDTLEEIEPHTTIF
jgi:hypothetical protein